MTTNSNPKTSGVARDGTPYSFNNDVANSRVADLATKLQKVLHEDPTYDDRNYAHVIPEALLKVLGVHIAANFHPKGYTDILKNCTNKLIESTLRASVELSAIAAAHKAAKASGDEKLIKALEEGNFELMEVDGSDAEAAAIAAKNRNSVFVNNDMLKAELPPELGGKANLQ
jgi:hypothetical protein